jgi:hypothetical protein
MAGRADKLRARAYARPSERKRGTSNQFVGKMPVITQQPAMWQGAEGAAISFDVIAYSEDGSPLTYQWQGQDVTGTPVNVVDGGRFSGAQTDNLIINPSQVGDDGDLYRCKVCNANTCVYSNWAAVDITGAVWNIITEVGSLVIDEPALAYVVDERSS